MIQKRKEKKMLKLKSIGIALPIAALILITGFAYAQGPGMHEKDPGREGMHGCKMSGHKGMIPGLSEEQQGQIKALKTEHMKAVQPLHNQLGEKKARLRTLTTADKVNMAEVNKVIDDIGKMQTQLMKLKEKHRQEIRKLLNDEQRFMFYAHKRHHYRPHHEGLHRKKVMR
jgi:Spy/CpxP family protein refolding chaperone